MLARVQDPQRELNRINGNFSMNGWSVELFGRVHQLSVKRVAIAQLAFAYGAWTLQPWAWSLGVVLSLVNIVWSVVGALGSGDIVSGLIGQAISIAISVAILYYLNTPAVKAAFGKSAA